MYPTERPNNKGKQTESQGLQISGTLRQTDDVSTQSDNFRRIQ